MGIFNSTRQNYAKNLLSDSLTKSYFSSIKTINNSRYKTNRYSKSNIVKCFEKDMDGTVSILSSNRQIRHYIPWYYYLYNSLIEKEKEGKQWAVNFIDELETKVFYEEPTHLSELFYEEFGIKHQPKELKDVLKEQDDYLGSGIVSQSGSSLHVLNNKTISILNTTKHYGGSFISVDTENINHQDQTQMYRLSRLEVKEYTHVFKDRLSKQTHPLNIAITTFVQIYIVYMSERLKELEVNENKSENVNMFCKEVSEDIGWFAKKIQTTIKWFYCRTIDLEFFKKEKDDMFNMIVSIIFDIGNLHNLIYELYKLKYQNSVLNLDLKLKKIEFINPEDIGIEDKFCLNNVTRQKYKFQSSNDQNPYEINNNKAIIEQVNEEEETSIQPEIQNKPITNYVKDIPYSKAIKELKKISLYKSPFEKMLIITRLTTTITECINIFWKDEMSKHKPGFLGVATEDLVVLLEYIVIKSQFPEILIHLGIIQNFTPDDTQSSQIGFGFTNLLGIVGYLEEVEFNDIKELAAHGKKLRNE